MTKPVLDGLEQRMMVLHSKIRDAAGRQDWVSIAPMVAELKSAREQWQHGIDARLNEAKATAAQPIPTQRERAYTALQQLSVPASPKMIAAVDEAFGPGATLGRLPNLVSIRRDESRSWRIAPGRREWYICNALVLALPQLSTARGLLALSTWPLERRLLGPLSTHADRLTATINIAEQIQALPKPSHQAIRLLARLAASIPGVTATSTPNQIAATARAELSGITTSDRADRAADAKHVRRLPLEQQLFGAPTDRPAPAP